MKIQAIDLFCGIGGLTYGLRQAGIDVFAGLDNDASCKYAYTANNKKAEFIEADIKSYDFSRVKSRYARNAVKAIVGCAPCQPFSSHYNQKTKQADLSADHRWGLLRHFTRAVKEIQPEIISMENVPGLAKTEIFSKFEKSLKKEGYHITHKIVFCPDYGVPQNRRRLILLGSKIGGEMAMPRATHKPTEYPTVADALKGARRFAPSKDPAHKGIRLTEINLRRIRNSKPNGFWRDWSEELLPPCYRGERAPHRPFSSTYARMGWNGQAPTITTQFIYYGSGRFGHPVEDRAISVREGALLQAFPSHYDFGRDIGVRSVARHIGNAVPPALGKAIGKAMKDHLRKAAS